MTGEVGKAILILAVVVVAIIVVVSFSMMAMMGGYGWGGMMGHGMMGWGGMGFGWMMLWPMIFFVIIIIGIYFVVTWLKGEAKAPHAPDSTLEILKERYAKGEITGEEFRKMKRDLSG